MPATFDPAASLALAKEALSKGAPLSPDDALAKAYTQATGLVSYDLEAPAKSLFPVLTPLRNVIPRVPGAGGTATHWKAVTGINTARMQPGVSEGNRSGLVATTTADYTAAYKGIGLEDSVTFEADYAAQNFQDVKATASLNLLRAMMISEEEVILGGNGGGLLKLGTTNTPTATGAITGGSLAAATYSVICVALSPAGLARSSVAAGVPGQITRTNADGTTDTFGGGNAKKSAAATATVASGSAGSIAASVTPMPGAAGYAWYWGASGSEVLGAITTINSVSITADATGTQAPGTAGVADADYSYNGLIFDGLLTQILAPGSGAYVQALATGTAGTGTGFTSDGAGGIDEFNVAFQSFWDNWKLSPDICWVNARDLRLISKKIIANGGAPLIRYNLDGNNPGSVDAGTVIASILNQITNQKVRLIVHPNMPAGMVMFQTTQIPYPTSGIGNVIQMKMRRDYYQIEWPLVSRKYQYGVYADGVLQNYFPPAFGVLYNAAGV